MNKKLILFLIYIVLLSSHFTHSSENPNKKPWECEQWTAASAFTGSALATILFSNRPMVEKFVIPFASGLVGMAFGFGGEKFASRSAATIDVSEGADIGTFRATYKWGMTDGIKFSFGIAAFATAFSAVLLHSSRT